MRTTKFYLITIGLITLFSCNKDDDATMIAPESTLSELRDKTTNILTSTGNSKTWKISKATLTNGNSEIDITQNFNVVDDEFIFSGTTENGTLEWRKGYDIQTKASNISGTLLDKYVSPITTTFSYQDNSSTVVKANSGNSTFQVNEDNSVEATITNDDNTKYTFTLIEKTLNDFLSAPKSGLNFTTAFTFESDAINGSSRAGMIGSYADNSLFIATREDELENSESVRPERILKFDIATNTITENLFFKLDFVTKRLHIIGNQLIVVGGKQVNTYNLDLSGGDPVSMDHGKNFTRFGMTVLNDNAYLIGGGLNETAANKIYSWNIASQSLAELTTLPEAKYGTDGTIINDNLYVFGGTNTFPISSSPSSNKVYKVDVNDPSNIETLTINQAIDIAFVQKYQNLIYIAGQIYTKDSNNLITANRPVIGVFNTLDNSYQELNTNLTSSSGSDTIHQMCIFNNKMYVIYGNQGKDNGGQFKEWKILVSDLK